MKSEEIFGYLGLLFLIFGLINDDIIILRCFNIVATTFYIIQSYIMKSKSLIWTNYVIMAINVFMILSWWLF